MSPTTRTVLIALAVLATACTDQVNPPLAAPFDRAAAGLPKPAAVAWNEVARAQTLSHVVSQQAGARTFAYLSLAQYNAAVTAGGAEERESEAPAAAAVAGASAVVLASFYPDRAVYFDSLVRAQKRGTGEDDNHRWGQSEALGRAIGAAVLASAATDGFTSSIGGVVVPVCPGCWFSAPGKVPLFPLLGQMRPFFMSTGSQFRPGPPPAFGSPDYLAALAEVRLISDTRTQEQDSAAKFWATPGGFNVTQAYNNQTATDEITRFELRERRAALVLAVMNMAAMDAFIASHDAKYTYWLIRPPQADPGIVLAIGLPNHPSYPSNHASVTGSAMDVLASFFPSDAEYLRGLAQQAAISRIFGGIHYRFDADTGLKIGREAAALALSRIPDGHRPFPLQ
jgi:hypothetical protein